MNKRDDKRERILHAGLQVMFLKGYNGTGVKDIVDAAGIPKGSFYNYFESKEDFAVQAMQSESENGVAELRLRLAPNEVPPLQRLIAVFRGRVEATSEEALRRGCLLGNLCQEMSAVSEPIRNQVDRLMQTHIRVIQACLVEAQTRGELCAGLDPETTAEFIFDAWEGALLRSKCRQDKKPLSDFLSALAHLFGTTGASVDPIAAASA